MNAYDRYETARIEANPGIKAFFWDISRQTAENAYRNTSHFPERASAIIRADYAIDLLNDKEEILNTTGAAKKRGATVDENFMDIIETWFREHRAGVKQKYEAYLYSHASVASAFICGPSNFPTARNQKRSGWADSHYENIGKFRHSSKKRILKLILPYGDGHEIKTDDPDATNKIENKIQRLEDTRDNMKAVNKTVRKYYNKTDAPNPEDGKYQVCIEALEKLGYSNARAALLIKPDYMGYCVPFHSYQLTNIGAEIRRLKQREQEVSQTKSLEINDQFPNGETASISDDGKIIIEFGYKPDENIRTKLKSHAFKWSRARMAWVRKLTANAAADYYRHIKPQLQAA